MENQRTRQERFHDAAVAAYQAHGFKSYRDAEHKTGVNYSTIYTIVSRGRIPTRGQVIEWAEGLEENINYWLEMAGHEKISPGAVSPQGDPLERVIIALNGASEISEFSRNHIIEIVKKEMEKSKKE